MTRTLLACALVGALSIAARPAEATTIVGTAVDELAAAADEIVVGEVLSVQAGVRNGRVQTRVMIAPEVCYVGEPVPVIEIVVPGGRTGTLATWVSGADQYSVGERVLVFLEALDDGAFVSRALAFSKFSLVETADGVAALRDVSGLNVVSGTAAAPVPPDLLRARFEFAHLEAIILAAVSER